MESGALRNLIWWSAVARHLRNVHHGWSVRELCRRSGASREAVRRVESGGTIYLADLRWMMVLTDQNTPEGAVWYFGQRAAQLADAAALDRD